MDIDQVAAGTALKNAAEALQNGDRLSARRWAARAAALAKDREEPWLILAEISSPAARRGYLEQAVLANPNSLAAREALRKNTQESEKPRAFKPAAPPAPAKPPRRRAWIAALVAALLLGVSGCAAMAWFAQSALVSSLLTGQSYFPTSLVESSASPTRDLVKTLVVAAVSSAPSSTAMAPYGGAVPYGDGIPSGDAIATPYGGAGATATPTREPTRTATPFGSAVPSGDAIATATPYGGAGATFTAIPTQPPGSPTPPPTVTPGAPPAPAPAAPAQAAPAPSSTGKVIVVSIAEQHVYAYENGKLVMSFPASTGSGGSTLSGDFTILDKIANAYSYPWGFWMPDWMGIYYVGSDLENGFHSLPVLGDGSQLWGDQIGTPVTYGCVVLQPGDMQKLFDWADVGTLVEIR